MPALIFDCDGVLADTEKDGHLRAFNQTFDYFKLPVSWSVADYAERLKIGGGKERLKSLLTPEFIINAKLPSDSEEQSATVAEWHRFKTEIYTELVEQGVMPARPGIARIINEANEAGWKLAVASTSHEKSVRAVLNHAVGNKLAAKFSIFAGDIVSKKKPAPDIFLLTLEKLAVTADEVIVIEDSNNGLMASTSAGIRTVVTISSFTTEENFDSASLVISSLGDYAPGERTTVLKNPNNLELLEVVTLNDLNNILKTPPPV
jgi:HAD superfamily hydrolase (TIGR01509 family)